MTDKSRAREFYLLKDDLDFDLNWKKIHAAEYPYKDSVTNALRVIDYKAYLAIQQELEDARQVIEFYGDKRNWIDLSPYVSTPVIFKPSDSTGWEPQGDKAREFLTKYPKKEG